MLPHLPVPAKPCHIFLLIFVAKLNVDKQVGFDLVVVGNRRFIGEPIFISKGDKEDDGYLLVVEVRMNTSSSMQFQVQRCYLVILDPRRIGEADAVIARLEVPKNLNFPLAFHGFGSRELVVLFQYLIALFLLR
ncbi:hypothetical protein IFM89_010717 [Coptis chinensis]|uniref:Uncharacterized protein n=1 Tax=Coptis chinensis TaxID=261450 RepID=A0A835IP13_9MAGN|nr:hypothetical protein IFM89_010717 [Coptis chinensis]